MSSTPTPVTLKPDVRLPLLVVALGLALLPLPLSPWPTLVVMAPVQCFFFFFVAVWSGQLTSTALYNIPPAVFWTSVQTWMNPLDLPFMLVKALVFGLIIATVACGWGLTTRGGPKEVGTSTTGAVVMILILVALMDVVLTQVLFGA